MTVGHIVERARAGEPRAIEALRETGRYLGHGLATIIKAVEPVRLAYVNSAAFLDTNTGIKQLVRAAQSLELEFSSTQSELSLLNEKLRTTIQDMLDRALRQRRSVFRG